MRVNAGRTKREDSMDATFRMRNSDLRGTHRCVRDHIPNERLRAVPSQMGERKTDNWACVSRAMCCQTKRFPILRRSGADTWRAAIAC